MAHWSSLDVTRAKLYRETYYNPQWLQEQGVDIEPYCQQLRRFVMEGTGL